MYLFNGKNFNIILIWEYFFLVFAINVILFTFHIANPLPVSDCWFFINTFIRKIVQHTLTVEDFFRVRGAKDHAQPIQKLMLLFHTKFLSLDFSFDTIASIIAGLITVRWLVALLIHHSDLSKPESSTSTDRFITLIHLLVLCAIPFSILPFNVIVHYTWPLVSQFYITLPFILWFYFTFSKFSVEYNYKISLIVSTFVIVLLLDTLGVITVISALIYALLAQLKQFSIKRLVDILKYILPSAIAGRLIINSLKPKLAISTSISSKMLNGFDYLVNHLNELPLWITIPASSPFIHREWINSVLNKNETQIFIVILGSVIIVLHYWFWRMWLKFSDTLLSIFSALLMLYCYLSTIAILLFRIPDFGTNYLFSPRYVIFSYGLSVLALLIMLWQSFNIKRIINKKNSTNYIVTILLAIYISMQIIYIPFDWRKSSDVRKFHSNVAELLFILALNPAALPNGCEIYSIICAFDLKTRNNIISLLKNNKLSVFSPEFKLRHNIIK